MEDYQKLIKERSIEALDYTLNCLQANQQAYDKALLTLSSGALLLSLTLSNKLVPYDSAIWLWMLLSSWVMFVLVIITVMSNYIFSFFVLRKDAEIHDAVACDVRNLSVVAETNELVFKLKKK